MQAAAPPHHTSHIKPLQLQCDCITHRSGSRGPFASPVHCSFNRSIMPCGVPVLFRCNLQQAPRSPSLPLSLWWVNRRSGRCLKAPCRMSDDWPDACLHPHTHTHGLLPQRRGGWDERAPFTLMQFGGSVGNKQDLPRKWPSNNMQWKVPDFIPGRNTEVYSRTGGVWNALIDCDLPLNGGMLLPGLFYTGRTAASPFCCGYECFSQANI